MVTIVEDDLKAPFWLATITSCRGRFYSFSSITPLYSWSLPNNYVLSKMPSCAIFKFLMRLGPGLNILPIKPI